MTLLNLDGTGFGGSLDPADLELVARPPKPPTLSYWLLLDLPVGSIVRTAHGAFYIRERLTFTPLAGDATPDPVNPFALAHAGTCTLEGEPVR